MPLTGGAKKARSAMRKRYGAKKGDRIFYAKANKSGKGKSMHSKAQSAYKRKGRKR